MSRPHLAVVAHREKLTGKAAGQLRGHLTDQGFKSVAWITIPKGKAATEAVRRAVKDGADRIVVAGGDGTVRAAIQALAGTDVPLAVMPAGTANLFAGALGLPTDPAEVAAAAWCCDVRRIDTGTCNDLSFAVMGGTGLDATMIDGADAQKDRLGTLAYVKAGISAARQREPFTVSVMADGRPFYEGEASCVLVGNVGRLTGGIEAFPEAEPDDGVLDLAVVTATGLREWASVLSSAVRGRQQLSGHAHMGQASKITVKLDRKAPMELDGGTKGTAKTLRFGVRPASLSVCVAPA